MKSLSRFTLILASAFFCLTAPAHADLASEIDKASYVDNQFVKDEISAVKRVSLEWANNFNAHQPVKVVALYDEPFILYATFKSKIDTNEGLMKYFESLMKKKNMKVVFNEQNIRVHGPAAVDSGLYTFSYTDDQGKHVDVPARYTFVYTLTPDGWRIVDHHSSVLPE